MTTGHPHRILSTTLLVLAISLGSAACSKDADTAPPTSTLEPAPGTPAGTTTPAPTASATQESEPDGDDERPETITVDDKTLAAAQSAAEATMGIWVQGQTLDQQTWLQQFTDTLAPEAQPVYANRFGYKIPDTAIVGQTTPLVVNDEYGTFQITTDVATYEVTVLNIGDTWATSAIVNGDTGQRA